MLILISHGSTGRVKDIEQYLDLAVVHVSSYFNVRNTAENMLLRERLISELCFFYVLWILIRNISQPIFLYSFSSFEIAGGYQ